MSSTAVSEAQLAQHACELLSIHEMLLEDAPRNRAFYQALGAHVGPGTTVVDVGSGTGVWAIMAAKLGAARVVAIERDGLMCGIIRRLAQENGVADRVRVIEGVSSQVVLDDQFDVIISETIGHMIFDEEVVDILIDARQRFLRPGGVLIPQRAALVAAPMHLDRPREALPAALEASFGSFQALALHRPLPFVDKTAFRWLGDKAELVSADIRTVTASPAVDQLHATWTLADTAALDGVAVWMELQLSEGVALSTLDSAHWSATVYRFAPFAAAGGELSFSLALSAATHVWTGTLGAETQRFSPAIAATQMVMQHQADPRLLPHLLLHSQGPVLK